MAHALRRISYATCEPLHAQFSFLAREPRGQLSLQYCHSFVAASPQQVGHPSDAQPGRAGQPCQPGRLQPNSHAR